MSISRTDYSTDEDGIYRRTSYMDGSVVVEFASWDQFSDEYEPCGFQVDPPHPNGGWEALSSRPIIRPNCGW